ncbi:MAG: heavy-metal-associated domain-containing protein [Thiogranum sp.]|nr:heavy-metal-associated domain-containing protein [Thiogranum sp.]
MSETIHLTITGMTCNHCVAAVRKALAAVEGVEGVDVTLEPGGATVKGTAATEDLLAAVKQAGYEARA